MECEKGTKRARTQITKYLNLYIDENNLKNPENKRIIVPDTKLRKLLGDEIEGVELTYFTIQKYMNKHFV